MGLPAVVPVVQNDTSRWHPAGVGQEKFFEPPEVVPRAIFANLLINAKSNNNTNINIVNNINKQFNDNIKKKDKTNDNSV